MPSWLWWSLLVLAVHWLQQLWCVCICICIHACDVYSTVLACSRFVEFAVNGDVVLCFDVVWWHVCLAFWAIRPGGAADWMCHSLGAARGLRSADKLQVQMCSSRTVALMCTVATAVRCTAAADRAPQVQEPVMYIGNYVLVILITSIYYPIAGHQYMAQRPGPKLEAQPGLGQHC
jgi:hypothetical protein